MVTRRSFDASAMVDSTTAQRADPGSNPKTKARSNLSSVKGTWVSRSREEKPVPKSSMERPNPRIRSRARFSRALAALVLAELSLTSMGDWSLTPIQMIARQARRFEMRLTSYCPVLQRLGVESPGELAIHIIEYVCDGVFGEAFEAGVRRPTKVRREDDAI